jgi:K+-transporting ATPase ATPase C chain
MLRRQLLTAVLAVLTLTVLTGVAYPLVVMAVGQVAFPRQANGSVINVDGRAVGSSLLGQNFAGATYFHPRPSAAGAGGYDALASSASNLGPTSSKLTADCLPVPATDPAREPVVDDTGQPVDETNPDGTPVCDPNTVPRRVADYRATNDLGPEVMVPVDAVTASGSGLDPHISVANARLQAARVARQRHLPADQVASLIDQHTTDRPLGILGEAGVNVLTLNIALDSTRTG